MPSQEQCLSGAQYPVAAYFLNRDGDGWRRKFVENRLERAQLPAIRVGALDGGDVLKRVLRGGDATASVLAQQVLAQTRCAALYTRTGSALGCFSSLVQSGNCSHSSAYTQSEGPAAELSRGARQCSGYIANYMGKMRALLQIVVDADAGRFGPSGAHVLLLEDDTAPVPRWRTSYCHFVRVQPPSGWDIAKVDSDRARNVKHTISIASRFVTARARAAAGRSRGYVYTAKRVSAMRATAQPPQSRRANATMRTRVFSLPFAWGAAALVLHSSYARRLYELFDQAPIGSVDVHLLVLHLRGFVRVAMSDARVFNSGSNRLQKRSAIEGMVAMPSSPQSRDRRASSPQRRSRRHADDPGGTG
jgi:hypothetical protein